MCTINVLILHKIHPCMQSPLYRVGYLFGDLSSFFGFVFLSFCLFAFLSFYLFILVYMQSTPLSGRLFVRRFISLVLNANIYDQSLDSVGLVLRFVWLSGQISEKTPQSCPCNPKIGLYVRVRFRVHVRETKNALFHNPC